MRREEISNLIIHELVTMAESGDPYQIQSKRKALTAFFPYAVWMEKGGECRTMDAFLSATKVSGPGTSLWGAITPFISTLFEAASDQTVVLTSPRVPWDREPDATRAVTRWASAASEVPCTDEVGRIVVDALLSIASVDCLRPHIPIDIWSWLNKRPTLPHVCLGRSAGTRKYVVRCVRKLKDVEILKSYFLLVWSEWDHITYPEALSEMRMTIKKEFKGVEMEDHRKDLIKHLDYVLQQLNQGLGYLRQHKLWIEQDDVQRAKAQYQTFRQDLLQMDVVSVAGEEVPKEVPKDVPICECFFLLVIWLLEVLIVVVGGLLGFDLDLVVRSDSHSMPAVAFWGTSHRFIRLYLARHHTASSRPPSICCIGHMPVKNSTVYSILSRTF